MFRTSLAAACSLLLLAAPALADVVTRSNGATLTGKIVQESADEITLQSNVGELVTRTKIARKDIASIQRDVKPDASYCLIPIEGEIGREVKAQALEKALTQARSLNADYIILYVDSGGGDADEMVKIIELLKSCKDQKLIAHIKRAGSAAALIAMTCPTIIVSTDSSIGAAVPFKFGPDGTPKDVEAKWFSYFESIARGAAQAGGHSTMLVRGMMEIDVVLSRRIVNGAVEIVEGEVPGGTVIKKSGQILTFQGNEAYVSGLAAAISDDVTKTPALFGLKSWVSVGNAPWSYMKSHSHSDTDPKSQVDALNAKISANISKANHANDAINKLDGQGHNEIYAAADQYKAALAINRLPSEKAAAAKQAKDAYDAQVLAIRNKYEALIAQQRRIYSDAVAENDDLRAKLLKLAAAPAR